jgi:hypothetical protein
MPIKIKQNRQWGHFFSLYGGRGTSGPRFSNFFAPGGLIRAAGPLQFGQCFPAVAAVTQTLQVCGVKKKRLVALVILDVVNI